MPTTSDVVELSPQSPGHGGIAVARLDGQAVFVRGALPGERVRARITEVKKSYARATVVDVLDASPHRVPEACPAAAAGAGCCDLTIAAPDYQREWKTQVLTDLLVRFGRFAPGELAPAVGEITPALVSGWRHRARLHAGTDGALGWRGARSHDLVDAEGCAQLPAGFTAGLRGDPGGEVSVVLDDDGARHAVGPRGEVLDGTGVADYRVGESAWRLPAASFWQAHRDAAARYSELVDRWTAEALADGTVDPGSRAWDLYGGAGVFAAVLARRGLKVDVVETAADAIAAGRDALGGAVRFHRGDVARTVGRLRAPGLVVLDPPRAGAGKAVVAAVTAAAPGAVIHVGCDPAAFARDLALFRDGGYVVRDAVALDAFPGTHHLECLAVLTPGSAP